MFAENLLRDRLGKVEQGVRLHSLLRPLPEELAEVLKKLPAGQEVFDVKNLRKAFLAACVKIRLGTKIGPEVWQYRACHSWLSSEPGQKSHLSRALRAIAMRISGCLTESTFERYNIVDSADLDDAMAKVEKHFDGSLMEVERIGSNESE